MTTVVLSSAAAEARPRDALARALERFPAAVEPVAPGERVRRMTELAAAGTTDWIVLVDADAVPRADAFGSLRRALDAAPAIVTGRALVAGLYRLGAMFAPARSGPNPFELVPLSGTQADRAIAELFRGPIDVPQRGLVIVNAAFVRSLAGIPLDDAVLGLDLAVHARARGRAVLCEPSMAYAADDDAIEIRRRLADLRRFSAAGAWPETALHRDPPALRGSFINREVRVMGNYRGFARRPFPAVDVLVVANDDVAGARALRDARAVRGGGGVAAIAAADADALRAALARTGDRYLLVAPAEAVPDRVALEGMVERIEGRARFAASFERDEGAGAVLFHLGRIVNGGNIPGGTVAETIAHAAASLPRRRLFAVGPSGALGPPALPPAMPLRTIDIVFVAASRPQATGQTIRSLVQDPVEGTTTVLYPAGAETIATIVRTIVGLELRPDATDPHLAVGLNRTLGTGSGEGVLIVRDDVQVPRGMIGRLRDAFRRLPRLGVAVPRVGGNDRPEGLPELTYRSSADMQAFAERRGEEFAREAVLLDVATAPVLLVSREALEVVGGFDERFGFSRVGIEDFTRRVRAANFLVAMCDDAYAHLFAPHDAQSFFAGIDDDPALRAACDRRWSNRQGFDPQRDRVAFRPDRIACEPSNADRVRVLVPVATADEWARVRPFLADLAATFRAGDALDVEIGLDGSFGVQSAVSDVREILAATLVPLEATLNIRIEPVGDLNAWCGAAGTTLRAAANERESLARLPAIDGSIAMRSYLSEALK